MADKKLMIGAMELDNITTEQKNIIALGMRLYKETRHTYDLTDTIQKQFNDIADGIINKLKGVAETDTIDNDLKYIVRRETMLIYYVCKEMESIIECGYFDEEYTEIYELMYEQDENEIHNVIKCFPVRAKEKDMMYKEQEEETTVCFEGGFITTNLQ